VGIGDWGLVSFTIHNSLFTIHNFFPSGRALFPLAVSSVHRHLLIWYLICQQSSGLVCFVQTSTSLVQDGEICLQFSWCVVRIYAAL
jgi:hypothetical protein